MTLSKTPRLPESEVVRIWQQQMQELRHLEDSEGQPVEVIYPGRLNDSRGGDFRDAVINSGNQCKCGCIEIHTRTSGWQAHGHHRDRFYNQVVLHVAMKQDRAGKTLLQNGQSIPTVILDKYVHPETRASLSEAGLPCRGVHREAEEMAAFLDKAGDWRFAVQASRYQLELSKIEAGQTLYQGLLEALGYAKNKLPFLELARRVPLSLLEETLNSSPFEKEGLVRLQALLLGNAGFLPSQRSISRPEDKWVKTLERVWADFPRSQTLSCQDWELFKVRPGNLPVRRIVALSHLLYRFREEGWFQTLLNLVRTGPLKRTSGELELAFIVKAEGYWKNHYDFNTPDSAVSPVLLGRERAAEIIVNVLLPFCWSWGQSVAEMALGRQALEIYRHYPRLESNSVERHMLNQLALSRRQVNSAVRQQGLLHIYKTLCTQGKCGECWLAR